MAHARRASARPLPMVAVPLSRGRCGSMSERKAGGRELRYPLGKTVWVQGLGRRHECHRGTHECVRYKRPLATIAGLQIAETPEATY